MKTTHHPTRSVFRRLATALWRQRARQIPEPLTRFDGRRALVTGGNGGIGFAIAEGLRTRGADVVIACRNAAKATDAVLRLRSHAGPGEIDHARMALDDLASVDRCVEQLARQPAFDTVILNAGIWPKRYAENGQGVEIAFAVNVLGHAMLVEGLLGRGLIRTGARIVWMTGDIYVAASECTPDYRYRTAVGGQWAYCRAKLGNIWLRHAYENAHPEFGWYAAHPGVVSSNLAGDVGPRWLRQWLMVSPRDGARTALACATEPGLEPSYVHNTMGRVHLHPSDVGANTKRGEALRDVCLELMRQFATAGADVRK